MRPIPAFALAITAGVLFFSAPTAFADATFSFPEVKEERFSADQLKYMKQSASELIQNKDFFKTTCSNLLASSPTDPNTLRPPLNNGLVSTMLLAYSSHIPLVLRPDDVWLAITAAFGNYVNTHAEEMRSVFVKHDGQKNLVVKAGGAIATNTEDNWATLTGQMADEIDKNLTAYVKEWIVPDFSTSTREDKIASRIVMMGAMQKYFKYTMILACGLPRVTLEGSLQDWIRLRERAARLAWFGGHLKQWSDVLLPVLDQFVAAYQGNVDSDFWQRIATHKRLGSGGEKRLRGWFLAFAPFNAKGEYHLNSAEDILKTNIYGDVDDVSIADSIIHVPVKIDDNGNEHQTIFYGGVMAPQYNAETNELRPTIGWGIAEKGEK